jgi:hypothetical protein
MSRSCCWWRSLAVDGGSGASRGHARHAYARCSVGRATPNANSQPKPTPGDRVDHRTVTRARNEGGTAVAPSYPGSLPIGRQQNPYATQPARRLVIEWTAQL